MSDNPMLTDFNIVLGDYKIISWNLCDFLKSNWEIYV